MNHFFTSALSQSFKFNGKYRPQTLRMIMKSLFSIIDLIKKTFYEDLNNVSSQFYIYKNGCWFVCSFVWPHNFVKILDSFASGFLKNYPYFLEKVYNC